MTNAEQARPVTPAGGGKAGGAFDELHRAVLTRIETQRVDPAGDVAGLREVITAAVDDYQRRAYLGQHPQLHDPGDMTARLLAAITAFGPLTDLLARSDVEEIFLEGANVAYLDATGRLQGLAAPTTEAANRHVVDQLLASTQRTLDAHTPLVQARVLHGRARLTAAIPPIADTLSATIRRHTLRRDTLASLVERDTLTPAAADLLATIMRTAASVVVSGPPGAGKTSLLSALLAATPSDYCIRCCEEIRELHVPLTHGSFYEARPPAMDGGAEISLRDLVKFTLGMRPHLLVVGEVRGAEAFELTRAVNAGCGFACTVHANSARDALTALVNAAVMAGENVSEPAVRSVFASAIDYVVHLDLDEDTGPSRSGLRRQVMEVLAVVPSLHDDFSTEPILRRERLGEPLEWTGVSPPDAALLERRLPSGCSLQAVLAGRGADVYPEVR